MVSKPLTSRPVIHTRKPVTSTSETNWNENIGNPNETISCPVALVDINEKAHMKFADLHRRPSS